MRHVPHTLSSISQPPVMPATSPPSAAPGPTLEVHPKHSWVTLRCRAQQCQGYSGLTNPGLHCRFTPNVSYCSWIGVVRCTRASLDADYRPCCTFIVPYIAADVLSHSWKLVPEAVQSGCAVNLGPAVGGCKPQRHPPSVSEGLAACKLGYHPSWAEPRVSDGLRARGSSCPGTHCCQCLGPAPLTVVLSPVCCSDMFYALPDLQVCP